MATLNSYFLVVACWLAAMGTAASQCFSDGAQLKRVVQVQEECVRYLGIPCARLAVYNEFIYPNDNETQCMVRCMGLLLGWWDDNTGVQGPAMRHFFCPELEDTDYERRTYQCLQCQGLDKPSKSSCDACERAYESFRCYYEQYGNIIRTPQFVPLTFLQQLDMLFQCADVLQYPLLGSDSCITPSDRDFDCLLRCFMLKAGLYNEQYGPNLDRLYVQCNNYANETLFRQTTEECYQNLRSESLDDSVLVGRFLRECLNDGGMVELNHIIAEGVQSAVAKFI